MDNTEKEVRKYCEFAEVYLSAMEESCIWQKITDYRSDEEAEGTTVSIRLELKKELLAKTSGYLDMATSLSEKDNDVIYFLKAKIASAEGSDDTAIEYLSKAIELNPENSEYYNVRGKKLYEAGNYIAALEDFDKYEKLSRCKGLFYRCKSRVYFRLHDWLPCFRYIDKDIKYWDCSHSDYYLYLDKIKRAYEDQSPTGIRSETTKIIHTLNALIEEEPADIYFLIRGYIFEQIDLLVIAIENYTSALELNINPSICYEYRGWAYKKMRNDTAALADFKAALKWRPFDEELLKQTRF